MAASLRSSEDASDISDTRHYPAYPHHRARFPSLTDFPDSPSVYSPAPVYRSPRPEYSDGVSISRLTDPTAGVGFDDETSSTTRSLSIEDVHDDSDFDDCTDDASHRISLQGPKIRFHSRAPWETDDAISQSEDADTNAWSGAIGNKLRGKASRADTLFRTFTRGSSSRPSIDSTRSQVSAASSFDVAAGNYSNSRGALYDLAKQSMSSSSSSSTSTSAYMPQQSFTRTTNYSKSQNISQSHASLPRATVSLDGRSPSSMSFESVHIVPSSCDTFRTSTHPEYGSTPSPVSQERPPRDGFVHPYANPDLVASYTPPSETAPSNHPTLGDMSGSDSNSTVTDSTSPRSAAFSDITAETSSTSLTSRDLPQGNLRVNGKEISLPISVLRQSDVSYVDRNTKFLSLHPPPPGFEGPLRSNPRSPAVALISLQEAQARERVRSSTAHTTPARPKLPFPGADDISEITEDQTEEMDTVSIHARTRSISGGTRHKFIPQSPVLSQVTEIREEPLVSVSPNAVSGRVLKHKKSGFMRLFSGRNSEGDKERSPPPILPTDVHAEQSLQVGRPSKLTKASRPSFSPMLRASSASNTTRQPPSLSIITKASDHNVATPAPGHASATVSNFTPPQPLSLTVPQSAPPGNTDFTGLKLRPVSTSFSAHFADIVTGTVEAVQRDVHTPSSIASSITALSPFTPVSVRRSDDVSTSAIETSVEEQLTIKGLQDQLVSAEEARQQQIWELRGQIRDLTVELEDLRAVDNKLYCEVCGRGDPQGRQASPSHEQQPKKVGVVNRPRVRTGDTARFASGN
ncbi:hypothetical protein JVU11DRAFT_5044 [Chiua virens]|nr:hypothetical protein JVU11DRAFT_5044 [Chiua virens]